MRFIDIKNLLGCNNEHYHIKTEKRGSISCTIVFEEAPENPLQLMTFSTHRRVISIDQLRSISIDY